MPCPPCSIPSSLEPLHARDFKAFAHPLPLNTLPTPLHPLHPPPDPPTHEPSNPSSGSKTPVPFSFEPEDPLTFFVSQGSIEKSCPSKIHAPPYHSRISHIPNAWGDFLGRSRSNRASGAGKAVAVTTLKSDAGGKRTYRRRTAHTHPYLHIWN